MATLHELQTVYGCRDLYRLREMLYVKNFNEALVNQAHAERMNHGFR